MGSLTGKRSPNDPQVRKRFDDLHEQFVRSRTPLKLRDDAAKALNLTSIPEAQQLSALDEAMTRFDKVPRTKLARGDDEHVNRRHLEQCALDEAASVLLPAVSRERVWVVDRVCEWWLRKRDFDMVLTSTTGALLKRIERHAKHDKLTRHMKHWLERARVGFTGRGSYSRRPLQRIAELLADYQVGDAAPAAPLNQSTEARLDRMLDDVANSVPDGEAMYLRFPNGTAADAVLALSPRDQCMLAVRLAERLAAAMKRQLDSFAKDGRHGVLHYRKARGEALGCLLGRMLKTRLPFTDDQLSALTLTSAEPESGRWWGSHISRLVPMLEAAAKRGPLPASTLEGARRLEIDLRYSAATGAKLAVRLRRLIQNEERRPTPETTGPAGGPKRGPIRTPRTVAKHKDGSFLERSLLARETIRLAVDDSVALRFIAAIMLPPEESRFVAGAAGVRETDQRATVSFGDVAGPPAGCVATINRFLREAPADHRTEEYNEDDHARTLAKKMLRSGDAGVAALAGALAALGQRPIKHDFDSPRALRFHNGHDGVLHAVTIAIENLAKADECGLGEICDALSRVRNLEYTFVDWVGIAEHVTRLAKTCVEGASDAFLIRLLRFRERIARAEIVHHRVAVQTFDDAFGIGVDFAVDLGERWSDRMFRDIRAMRSANGAAWAGLLAVCAAAGGSKPTDKWLKMVESAMKYIPRHDVEQKLVEWLPLVGKARPALAGGQVAGRDSSVPSERGADVLRGLAWIAARFDNPPVAQALGDLAMAGFKMVPGVGARCQKPANAAVWALSQMKGTHALAQLSRIRQLVKFGTAKKTLDRTLDRLAADLKVTTDELHEIAAPDFGLGPDGAIREEAGDFTLELRLTPDGAEVRIVDASGKQRTSVPEAVRRDHAPALKALKLIAADIDKMLPAQKCRLERLYHDDRSWPLPTWRQRYIEHPLVGSLARRLIWNFKPAGRGKAQAAIWLDNAFVDSRGRSITLHDDDTVSLWHPALVPAPEVQSWRTFLEDRQLRQPFKQAHREIYLLSDAERATETYSNRFAAHIIRQAQFNALCQERGWRHTLFVLEYGEPPTLNLPHWDLCAHFMVSPIGDESFGTAGASAHLQTDQVAFTRPGGGENIPLAEIPPLAFSEVMRDVDLFIGVCSIGNNPQWQDGGPGGVYVDYWWTYGFGDLSGTGESRRETLRRLLPRLRIAAACELGDKFLTVKGKIRTYKVHLGSGNILMEPNDQYLCIVPGRGDAASTASGEKAVFLPFEGDRTLSIILSKAFMLAEDDKIKDPSITRQVRG